MKKRVCLFFCLAMFISWPYMLWSDTTEDICGDVTGDGIVNIVDALVTAKVYVGLPVSVFLEQNADIDGNGSINVIDALLMAQHYVGLYNQLLCPGSSPEPTIPEITWSRTSETRTIGNGSVNKPLLLNFKSNTSLDQIQLDISPLLKPFVYIETPSLESIEAGQSYEFSLVFRVPQGTTEGSYSGTLSLLSQGKVIPMSFAINLTIDYGDLKLMPQVKPLSDEALSRLRLYDIEKGLFVFETGLAELENLGPGDIIAASASPKTPYGLAHKIIAIRHTDRIIIETIRAQLNEIVMSGRIGFHEPLDQTSSHSSGGGPLDRDSVEGRVIKILDDLFDIPAFSIDQAFSCGLRFDFDADLYFDMSISFEDYGTGIDAVPQLDYFILNTYGSVTISLFAEAKEEQELLGFDIDLIDKLKEKTKIELKMDIPLQIGPVPVTISVSPHLKLGVQLTTAAGVSAELSTTRSLKAGIEYRDGHWEDALEPTTIEPTSSLTPSASVDGKLYCDAGLKVKISAGIPSRISGSDDLDADITVTPYVRNTLNLKSDLIDVENNTYYFDWYLKYLADFYIDFRIDVSKFKIASKSFKLGRIYEKILDRGNMQVNISENPSIKNVTLPSTLQENVYGIISAITIPDNVDGNIGELFDGDFSSMIRNTNGNGDLSVIFEFYKEISLTGIEATVFDSLSDSTYNWSIYRASQMAGPFQLIAKRTTQKFLINTLSFEKNQAKVFRVDIDRKSSNPIEEVVELKPIIEDDNVQGNTGNFYHIIYAETIPDNIRGDVGYLCNAISLNDSSDLVINDAANRKLEIIYELDQPRMVNGFKGAVWGTDSDYQWEILWSETTEGPFHSIIMETIEKEGENSVYYNPVKAKCFKVIIDRLSANYVEHISELQPLYGDAPPPPTGPDYLYNIINAVVYPIECSGKVENLFNGLFSFENEDLVYNPADSSKMEIIFEMDQEYELDGFTTALWGNDSEYDWEVYSSNTMSGPFTLINNDTTGSQGDQHLSFPATNDRVFKLILDRTGWNRSEHITELKPLVAKPTETPGPATPTPEARETTTPYITSEPTVTIDPALTPGATPIEEPTPTAESTPLVTPETTPEVTPEITPEITQSPTPKFLYDIYNAYSSPGEPQIIKLFNGVSDKTDAIVYATGIDDAVEVVVEYAQKAALVQVSIGFWGDLSGSSSYSVEIFRDNGKGGFVSLGKVSQTHSGIWPLTPFDLLGIMTDSKIFKFVIKRLSGNGNENISEIIPNVLLH